MTLPTKKQAFLILLGCLLLLALTIPATAAPAKKFENGALTPPPPPEDFTTRYYSTTSGAAPGTISINSTWNSSDLYLSQGTSNLSNKGNGSATYAATTMATQIVEKVGAQAQIQRWTGSYWTTVLNSENKTMTNDQTCTVNGTVSIISGYYYRVVSTHWVSHNGRYESGVTNGFSTLMQ